MDDKTLDQVLDVFAAAAESFADAAVLADEATECPMCSVRATAAAEHDPDCGYRIARTRITPHDVARVRRLARVLRDQ